MQRGELRKIHQGANSKTVRPRTMSNPERSMQLLHKDAVAHWTIP